MTDGRRRAALDVVIAALAVAVELALLLDDGSASVAAGVLTVAAGGALAVRRRAPLLVLATALTAATAIVALGETPSGLTVLVALYTSAVTCERSVSLVALLPTMAVTTAVSIASSGGDVGAVSPGVGAVSAAALTAGTWGLGAYAQTRRRYQAELEARAERLEREREQLTRLAVQQERLSIARELHDIVAHSVTVMLVGVRGARDVMLVRPAAAEQTLAGVELTAERSLVELRRILAILRAPSSSAESRPQPSLRDVDALVGEFRAAGLPVRLVHKGTPRGLDDGAELSAYRIVQEALTNALKHGRGSTDVVVTVAFAGAHLELEVVDDGAPPATEGDAPRGQGLVGLRERVELLDGELEAGRRPVNGFRVAARLPIGGEA